MEAWLSPPWCAGGRLGPITLLRERSWQSHLAFTRYYTGRGLIVRDESRTIYTRHMNQSSQLPPAMLLVGPTGAGKSPLGEEVQRRSGWLHFDFGMFLRAIASGTNSCGLDSRQIVFVRELVESNALFPDESFPLVQRILDSAIAGSSLDRGLILNGLPRTVSQAVAMESIVKLRGLVFLDCPMAAVMARVERRARGLGADHAGRADDTKGQILRKLTLFEEQTRPMLEHYSNRGVPLRVLSVGAESSEVELADQIGTEFFGCE